MIFIAITQIKRSGGWFSIPIACDTSRIYRGEGNHLEEFADYCEDMEYAEGLHPPRYPVPAIPIEVNPLSTPLCIHSRGFSWTFWREDCHIKAWHNGRG
jgi:hypothetical protein